MAVAAYTSRTLTYQGPSALAAEKYFKNKGVRDNAFSGSPGFKALINRIEKTNYDGGSRIVFPLTLARDDNDGSYSNFGTVDTNIPDLDTVLNCDSAEYFKPFGESFRQRDQIRGPRAVVKNWEHQMDLAMKRMYHDLEAHLYLDGTGNSSQRYIGLGAWVDDVDTLTVAGINRSNVTAFRNQNISTVTRIALLLNLRTLFSACRINSTGKNPTMGLCSQNFRSTMEGLADYTTTTATYSTMTQEHPAGQMLDRGYPDVGYYGVKFTESPEFVNQDSNTGATEGEAYILTPESFLWINCSPFATIDGMFEVVDATRPFYQTAKVGGFRLHGQLVCVEPRANGIITDVGADA